MEVFTAFNYACEHAALKCNDACDLHVIVRC